MSYSTILSVINEQTASTVTARYAISLALSCKARLVLYAAHDVIIPQSTVRHLDHLYTIATELGISVTRIAETGNIRTLLPKRVQAENADLVLYPLMSLERYGSTLQRHTVHHLLRSVKSDIAIMRTITMAKPHPGRILVPLGTIINDRELRVMFIKSLANCFHSQVTLFHLVAERETKGASDDITWFRNELQQQNITVLERSGRGVLNKVITVEAITRHNDLIVLGASERGVIRRAFFGNPVGDLMHQPPCNIILFRAAL